MGWSISERRGRYWLWGYQAGKEGGAATVRSDSGDEWSGDKDCLRVDAAEVDALIAARLAARAGKDWAESDRIRDQLTAMGVVLEDGKGGTTWRLAD
jgi:cysteinyl-tRNA synthetase